MEKPTADATYLMEQATHTAAFYLSSALHDIDKRICTGYAREHPNLIAAYMITAALDYHASATLSGAFEIAEHQP
jgi:hypothetical protein